MGKVGTSPPKRRGNKGGSFKDIKGHRQSPPGRLKATAFLGRWDGHSWWRCVCSCGRRKVVSLWAFRNGNTKSCGCLHRELARQKGKAKRVTDEVVEDMVRLRRLGFTYKALGRMFGRSPSRVCCLVHRWSGEHNLGGGRYVR